MNERTAWAMSLEGQIKAQSETIARQQQEFEERTTWALKLEEELKNHKEALSKERTFSKQLDNMASSFVYRALSRLKLLPRIRGR